jgi:hypothetical protein
MHAWSAKLLKVKLKRDNGRLAQIATYQVVYLSMTCHNWLTLNESPLVLVTV